VTTDSFQMRLLDSGDFDRYRRLRLEALQAAPTAFGSSYETEVSARADKYRDRLSGSAENYVLGAWCGEELVGMVGFVRETVPKRQHIGSVWGMYVAAKFRRRSLGRRLLVELIERAQALPGLEHVLLTVVSDNDAAQALYRSLGFEPWGTEPAALKVDGIDYDDIHMLLRLRKTS
jgi:ribosomal protein S18 acetylase RimI-like enzyme